MAKYTFLDELPFKSWSLKLVIFFERKYLLTKAAYLFEKYTVKKKTFFVNMSFRKSK